MKNPVSHSITRLGLSVLLLFGLFATAPLLADVVYVTSLTSNCTSTTICGGGTNPDLNSRGNPVYAEGVPAAGFTGAVSTAPGKPTEPGARYFSNSFSNSTPDLGTTISPTLAVPGGVYQIHHVYSSAAGNVSTTILMGITNVDGCTLSATNTDKFQRSFGAAVGGQNVWQLLGFVTNNPGVSNPIIRFYRVEGAVSAGAQQRVLFDTFRFSYYQPCLDIPVVGITGPLATNLAVVKVTGVNNTATQVTIYQDAGTGMTNVGTLPVSSPGATVDVPVSGVLVRGAQVAATQTVGGQEGCVPAAGLSVGGGANPSARVALSIRYDPTATGPVGNPGTTAGNVFFLGASTTLSGSAPADGAVLQPSTNWQTISFLRGDQANPTDPSVLWAGTGPAVLEGEYGALDGLGIACEGDSGPFEIYLDSLRNGTNGLVQGWEAAALGAVDYQFSHPTVSGTTSGNLLGEPNDSIVTNSAAQSGVQSCRVRFQFNGTSSNKWLRLVTAGNVGATVNPLLQLTEPISIRVLLLPPGGVPPPPPPIADFTFGPASGLAPLTVNFTNTSTGNVSTNDWDFGDGSAHGSGPNAVHTYTTPGTYTVRLTAIGPGNTSDEKTAVITVSGSPAIKPAFSAISISGASVVLTGTNGPPNATYVVLSSTDLSLAVSNWTALETNQFDGSGNFNSTLPAAFDLSVPQRFFLLQLP